MTTSEAAGARPPVYKRKMRNYLLDAGLQLRYTATIVVVAIFLTAERPSTVGPRGKLSPTPAARWRWSSPASTSRSSQP